MSSLCGAMRGSGNRPTALRPPYLGTESNRWIACPVECPFSSTKRLPMMRATARSSPRAAPGPPSTTGVGSCPGPRSTLPSPGPPSSCRPAARHRRYPRVDSGAGTLTAFAGVRVLGGRVLVGTIWYNLCAVNRLQIGPLCGYAGEQRARDDRVSAGVGGRWPMS